MKSCIPIYLFLLLISSLSGQTNVPFRDSVFCNSQNISISKPQIQDSIEFFEWNINNQKVDNIQNIKIDKETRISYLLKTIQLPNLVINGNFENGDRDFRTQYVLIPTKCSGEGFSFCEGAYGVTDNPQNVHSLFYPCLERKNTRGNLLVINGSATKQNVWCQTINLNKNTEYIFSFWGSLAYPDNNPAEVKISINNGSTSKNFKFKKDPCDWQEFKMLFNSNNQSSIEICISNETVAIGGNDFIIDDIALNRIESKSDTIILNYQPLLLKIEGPESVNCKDQTPKVIEAVSNKSQITYNWETTNGKILSRLDEQKLTIGTGGLYKVTIIDTLNDCRNSNEIDILTIFDGNTNLFYPNIVSLNAQNPVNRSFIIVLDDECAANKAFDLDIFDRWGNLVFQKNNSTELKWDLRFNDQMATAGTYTFIVSTKNELKRAVATKGSFSVVD